MPQTFFKDDINCFAQLKPILVLYKKVSCSKINLKQKIQFIGDENFSEDWDH